MKEICSYYVTNQKCYTVGDKPIHVGTENKIKMIEKYVEAWINKICQCQSKLSYKGIIFVDAMANSGYYQNKDKNEIKGTSLRVANLFEKYCKKYTDFSFEIILNDIDYQAIECQKCHLHNINPKVKIYYKNYDVKDIITCLINFLQFKKNVHILFFYDPFNVDIHWNEIVALIKRTLNSKDKGIDLILTHFHQNDPNRGLLAAKSPEVIKRYERSYQMHFEEIQLALSNKTGPERRQFFRNRILDLLKQKLQIDGSKLAYAPVFNSVDSSVYDIVFFSRSLKAKELFKKEMYRQQKTKYEPKGQLAFPFFDNPYSSVEKEKHVFCSPYFFAREIYNNFYGRNVKKKDLKKYLDTHVYIPNVIQDINKNLKDYFNVEIASKKNGYVYKFPINDDYIIW